MDGNVTTRRRTRKTPNTPKALKKRATTKEEQNPGNGKKDD